MKIMKILQVRYDSKRLPGKAFFWTPFGPLFVLAALRASSSDIPCLVATSDDKGGNLIKDVANKYKLDVIQGSKEDVLSRFVVATTKLNPKDYVVRLTGDNIVPDDKLIRGCLDYAIEGNYDYVATDSANLPYGVSVEVIRKSVLDLSHLYSKKTEHREHVTLWITQSNDFKKSFYSPSKEKSTWADLRVTIDTLYDYSSWLPVFLNGKDLLSIPWIDLVDLYERNNRKL